MKIEDPFTSRIWAAVYGAMFASQLDRLRTAQVEVTPEIAAQVDAMAASAADLAVKARAKELDGASA
jgi:hypothetical protein